MKKVINSLSIVFFILSGFIAYQASKIPDNSAISRTIVSNPIQKSVPPESEAIVEQPPEPVQKEPRFEPRTTAEKVFNLEPVGSAYADSNKPVITDPEKSNKPVITDPEKEAVHEEKNSPPPVEHDLIKKAEIEKVEVEKVLTVIGPGVFQTGQAIVQENLMHAVDAIIPEIPANSDYHLVVEGHTSVFRAKSPDGSSYLDNDELSVYRAQAVADMLIKRGIPAERVTVVGYGNTRPVASDDTYEGRVENRRVEVKLITRNKV